jgi:hypothetical protein
MTRRMLSRECKIGALGPVTGRGVPMAAAMSERAERGASQLGVQSRHLEDRVEDETIRLRCPGLQMYS